VSTSSPPPTVVESTDASLGELVDRLCNDNPDPVRSHRARRHAQKELRARRFAQALVDAQFDATAAYRACFPTVSERVARRNGHRLQRTDGVRKHLRELVSAAEITAKVNLVGMLKYADDLLHTSVLDLFTVDAESGQVQFDARTVSAATRRAIASIGIGEMGNITGIKMADKVSALRIQLEIAKAMQASGQSAGVDAVLEQRLTAAKRRKLTEFDQRKITQLPHVVAEITPVAPQPAVAAGPSDAAAKKRIQELIASRQKVSSA
jgi:hypothetical protein